MSAEGDRLTPERIRAVAKAPRTQFWEDGARQTLLWCADLVEAAEMVMAERKADQQSEIQR